MNYTLHQLKVFCHVADQQSITKAADLLHLSQPAVSIQLKNFQDQFDIPLTEQIGRKLFITDFGKSIAVAAAKILEEVEGIEHKASAFKGLTSGRLTIASVSTGKYVMPYFLSPFLQLHPGVRLSMDVTNRTRVIESLQKNELDFALVSVLPDNVQVKKLELMPNTLYLVGNERYIKKYKANPKMAPERIPYIFRELGSATRLAMESYLNTNNIQLRQQLELTSNEAVKQALIAGLGLSVMPVIGISRELREGQLHIIPVKGLPIKTEWNLIWLKDKRLSPAAYEFLSYVEREKNNIIETSFNLTS